MNTFKNCSAIQRLKLCLRQDTNIASMVDCFKVSLPRPVCSSTLSTGYGRPGQSESVRPLCLLSAVVQRHVDGVHIRLEAQRIRLATSRRSNPRAYLSTMLGALIRRPDPTTGRDWPPVSVTSRGYDVTATWSPYPI